MARILIAEDDGAIREFVVRGLTHGGHEATAVEDGFAALDALTRQNFDLLLTDIAMPGLDGIALALKVAKDHPKTAILLMTGFAAERQRAHNLEALFHEVLQKPFSLDVLLMTVSQTLESQAQQDRRR